MPELPEVEIVKRQLVERLELPRKILKIEFSPFDLRNPMPRNCAHLIEGQRILQLDRRGKYIIFKLESGDSIVTHLGMTGKWRFKGPTEVPQKHDHILITLESSLDAPLVYNDARRFGFFEFCKKNQPSALLKDLGPEPLSPEFDGSQFYESLKPLKSPIKTVLMNSKIVVGVGNIYASEALFTARISPFRRSSRLSRHQCQLLVEAVKNTLSQSLLAGGSSIENYRHVSGEAGAFQKMHKVYDRAGLSCYECSGLIKRKVQVGRSTFWCPHCQK